MVAPIRLLQKMSFGSDVIKEIPQDIFVCRISYMDTVKECPEALLSYTSDERHFLKKPYRSYLKEASS